MTKMPDLVLTNKNIFCYIKHIVLLPIQVNKISSNKIPRVLDGRAHLLLRLAWSLPGDLGPRAVALGLPIKAARLGWKPCSGFEAAAAAHHKKPRVSAPFRDSVHNLGH
jgi:hypothetical protein